MQKNLFIAFILFLSFTAIFAHEKGGRIIIDTDAAPDDLRAICMLLSCPDIEVLAITTSDGALNPAAGAQKIMNLLKSVNRTDIAVGIGKELGGEAPAFREFCSSFYWGDETGQEGSLPAAGKLLIDILDKNQDVSLFCMGPLTNISGIVETAAKSSVRDILWYSSYIIPMKTECFNYDRDPSSAKKVMNSGIPMTIISNLENEKTVFDMELLNNICKGENPYAQLVCTSHNQAEVIDSRINTGHFKLWDDLLVVYYLHPGYFKTESISSKHPVRRVEIYDVIKVWEAIEGVFNPERKANHVVMKEFPHDPDLFRQDVAPYVNEIIQKYGEDEWKACLLTNEIHGHLGIYSLVGSKMGIRAREYFNVGIDKLEVISFAGTHPPFSCLNDGLQVSTGATLGQGTISINTDSMPKTEAIFIYGNRQIKISMKPEYQKKFKTDIEEALLKYDLSQDGYWQLVREQAIRYWLELDRNEMFMIEMVDSESGGR